MKKRTANGLFAMIVLMTPLFAGCQATETVIHAKDGANYALNDTVSTGGAVYTVKEVKTTEERNAYAKEAEQVVTITYEVMNTQEDEELMAGADIAAYSNETMDGEALDDYPLSVGSKYAGGLLYEGDKTTVIEAVSVPKDATTLTILLDATNPMNKGVTVTAAIAKE